MVEINLQYTGNSVHASDILEVDGRPPVREPVEVKDGLTVTYQGNKVAKSVEVDVVVNFALEVDVATVAACALWLCEKFKNKEADPVIEGEKIEELSKENIEEALENAIEREKET